MRTQKTTPFFKEAGNMLNLIRNFRTELNDAVIHEKHSPSSLFNFWHSHNVSIFQLKAKLLQLENDIAFFFTEKGYRMLIDNRINTLFFTTRFFKTFRQLANEYINIKSIQSGNQANRNKSTRTEKMNAYHTSTIAATVMN